MFRSGGSFFFKLNDQWPNFQSFLVIFEFKLLVKNETKEFRSQENLLKDILFFTHLLSSQCINANQQAIKFILTMNLQYAAKNIDFAELAVFET